MLVNSVISRYTKEDTDNQDDIGRMKSIVFQFTFPDVKSTFQMSVYDGENYLDDPSIWMDLLQNDHHTLTFGCSYSHVDNGEILIYRDNEIVSFANNNALGSDTLFTVPFDWCKETFAYLRDECLKPHSKE